MRLAVFSVVGAAVMVVASASALHAQSERSLVSVTSGGSFGAGGAAPFIGVAGGVQLAPHAGLEIELSYVPGQEFTKRYIGVPQSSPAPTVTPAEITVSGRTVAALASFVTRFDAGRMRPFAQFGGGIANLGYTEASATAGAVTPTSPSPIVVVTDGGTTTETALALTAGGGVAIRLRPRMGLSADARYMRWLGTSTAIRDVNQNIRIGARLEFWF